MPKASLVNFSDQKKVVCSRRTGREFKFADLWVQIADHFSEAMNG